MAVGLTRMAFELAIERGFAHARRFEQIGKRHVFLIGTQNDMNGLLYALVRTLFRRRRERGTVPAARSV